MAHGSAGWEQGSSTWRAKHAAELQKDDGWLSLSGLEWLQPGDNSFGSAEDNKIHLAAANSAYVGTLRLEGNTVQLLAPVGGFPSNFQVAGAPARPQTLQIGAESDKHNTHFTIGTLNMYVVRRADRFALRIKDSKSAALLNFHGLKWYEPNAEYRVKARWVPYNPARSVSLVTLIGTTYSQPVPGVAEFALAGKTYRLEPVLEDPDEAKLFFIIRDTTSTSTTYGACRFLYTGFPSHGLAKSGELILDFNRLENPPCAYTPYSTCPLPPQGNRLPIALPVGEKRYHD